MNQTEPEQLVEHFFRRESAGLVALLARKFGFACIDVVEDMIQEALMEALRSWRLRGVPDNPTAWLHRVARNRIIDSLRRDQLHAAAVDELTYRLEDQWDAAFAPESIEDSLLRMIFACCHPTLDRASQLALSLKVLCGLGNHEIARGLLISAEAAKKRVTRAKRQLQLNHVALEFPGPALLNERLDAVHDVLYLMFNEGYSATRGESPLRIDLCEEAARLCHLLCESEVGAPTTRALMALMLFHAARFDSRMTSDGATVLLQDQDRDKWDRDMMRVAEYWLQRSAQGKDISRFHLEAGVARMHCRADSIADTDWLGVLRHYELLGQLFPSPMYSLNQAIVLGQLGRPNEGLQLLRSIENDDSLKRYALLPCAMADLSKQLGDLGSAKTHWLRAMQLVESTHERELIQRRLDELERRG